MAVMPPSMGKEVDMYVATGGAKYKEHSEVVKAPSKAPGRGHGVNGARPNRQKEGNGGVGTMGDPRLPSYMQGTQTSRIKMAATSKTAAY
mmetsp:Transcript_30865/g.52133  ORF Transcript_30865/g.52133 Transcript_30865/m.52133 type:complete len:90 (+) Transcript_30865:1-270(+)